MSTNRNKVTLQSGIMYNCVYMCVLPISSLIIVLDDALDK